MAHQNAITAIIFVIIVIVIIAVLAIFALFCLHESNRPMDDHAHMEGKLKHRTCTAICWHVCKTAHRMQPSFPLLSCAQWQFRPTHLILKVCALVLGLWSVYQECSGLFKSASLRSRVWRPPGFTVFIFLALIIAAAAAAQDGLLILITSCTQFASGDTDQAEACLPCAFIKVFQSRSTTRSMLLKT
jgi:hypothetical protein